MTVFDEFQFPRGFLSPNTLLPTRTPMSQTTTTSTTHLSAAQQHLLATPLGRYFGQDVLALEALFPGAELSAMAEALEDENHDVYASLKAADFLKNGEIQCCTR